jgi:hypothetical protein
MPGFRLNSLMMLFVQLLHGHFFHQVQPNKFQSFFFFILNLFLKTRLMFLLPMLMLFVHKPSIGVDSLYPHTKHGGTWDCRWGGGPCDGRHIIVDCIVVTNTIEPTTSSNATTGNVPVPPAPLSSFANNRGRRNNMEEEGGSIVVGHHGPAPCVPIGVDGRMEGYGGRC